jgi:glycosyltransferase involved in cell wall biosynthesis
MYNGVDTNCFQTANKDESRKKLGLPDKRKIVLSVRRLVYKNGLGTLIESVPYVAKEFPDVLFVLAGKGPSRQLIEDHINELGIAKNVMLTGFVPDDLLPVYYNASDYFVLPSASGEGLPLVLFEAMACGIPVVATTVGGTPEIVEQKKNGVLVPARNPKLMANALLELLKDEKLTETIGEKARADVVSRFSWDENARKLEQVYKQFLS